MKCPECPWCGQPIAIGEQTQLASEEGPIDYCPHCARRIEYVGGFDADGEADGFPAEWVKA